MFTRCAHCESTFRVSLAQLQVSGGQVRCGVCLEVFDAFLTLSARDPRLPAPEHPVPPPLADDDANAASLTLEAPLQQPVDEVVDDVAGAVPSWPSIDSDPLDDFVTGPVNDGETAVANADSTVPGDPEPVAVDEATADALTEPDVLAGSVPVAFDDDEILPLPALDQPDIDRGDVGGIDESAVAEALAAPVAPAQSDPVPIVESTVADAFSGEPPAALQKSAPPFADGADVPRPPIIEAPAAPDADVSPAPDEQEADHAVPDPAAPTIVPSAFAPPRPSRTSPTLVAGAASLALLLIGQSVYLLRATIAEAAPSARPALETACRFLRCSVELPRLTDRLTIESSDLQALDPLHPNRVTLTATIRNRARVEQALPLLELTLTDAREDVAARKVFGPAEYLSAAPAGAGVAANAELGVRLPLDTGDIVATGYRLYLFHP